MYSAAVIGRVLCVAGVDNSLMPVFFFATALIIHDETCAHLCYCVILSVHACVCVFCMCKCECDGCE